MTEVLINLSHLPDVISPCNLPRLYETHRAKVGRATMALHWRDDAGQSGIVGLDEDDRVVRFLEKPRTERSAASPGRPAGRGSAPCPCSRPW